jgi:hypothetical protein
MTSAPTDEASAAATALTEAVAAIDRFAQVEGWQLAEAELAEALVTLTGLSRKVGAQAVRVLAEADSRGLPARAGHARAAGWVRQVLPTTSPRDAAALARRADALYTSPAAVDLGPTRAAVLAGAIGLEHADVLTATITALQPPAVPAGIIDPEVLDQAQVLLVEQGKQFEPGQLRRLAGYLRDRLDPDADDRLARDEDRQQQARSLTLAPLPTGLVHLEGTLTPACGAALRAALDPWSAPQPATFSAALTGTTPDGAVTPGGPATLPDGTPLSSTSLAQIACDAELVPVLIDDLANPLDVGDTQYAFPTRQRTAITVRDQHCTYPGCTAPPPWTDIHHLTAFNAGGPTAVHNGTLLCRRHHRHVHATGQTGHLNQGHITWDTAPAGAPDSSPPTAGPARSLTRAHQALDHLIHRHLTRRRQ